MRQDMQADGERLGRVWDAHQAGVAPDARDTIFLDAIRDLEAVLSVPAASPELIARTWEQITGAPLPLAPYPVAAPVAGNGHQSRPTAVVTSRRTRTIAVKAAVICRLLVIGVTAGLAAGFLTGLWSRVAMRLSGFLTDDANRFIRTENNARVGDITLGGTLTLGAVGAALGILGGLLYLAIRRWLPGRSWVRALTYGALLLAVFGFVVMDPNNRDYQLFGPVWINVGTLSLSYVLFGLMVGLMADGLDRRLAPVTIGASRRRLATYLIAGAPCAVLGGVVLLGGAVGLADVAPLVLAGLLLAAVAMPIASWLIGTGWLQLPAPGRRFWYATWTIPALAGCFLTIRSIVEIMHG